VDRKNQEIFYSVDICELLLAAGYYLVDADYSCGQLHFYKMKKKKRFREDSEVRCEKAHPRYSL